MNVWLLEHGGFYDGVYNHFYFKSKPTYNDIIKHTGDWFHCNEDMVKKLYSSRDNLFTKTSDFGDYLSLERVKVIGN